MIIKGWISEIRGVPDIVPLYRKDDDTIKYGSLGTSTITLVIVGATVFPKMQFPMKNVEVIIKEL